MIYDDGLRQIQQDIVDKLNSESFFAGVPAISLDEMVIASEISKLMPQLVGKGGKVGCGMLVNYPDMQGLYANVVPPQSDILISVDCIENPEQNWNLDIGARISAQRAARQVRALLHGFVIYGIAVLTQADTAIEAVPLHKELFPNCRCFRANFRGRFEEIQQAKCLIPAIAENNPLQVTLSTTDGATIFYTTDGSFPGPGNAAATQYQAPFNVLSGTTVRWASFLAGINGSDVKQSIIT